MPTTKHIWSIRRICLFSIIGLISLLSIISISIITQQHTNSYNTLAENHIKYWANVLTEESRSYLVNSERQALKDNLVISEQIPTLNYLHIYQLNKRTEALELFYSYKRDERRSAIAEKSNDIESLLIPRFKEKYLEYMQAIKVNEKIIGFIYLQNSTEHIVQVTDKLLVTSIVLIVIVILISIFIALQLERYISAPFLALTSTMQVAARQKNFRQQCEAMPYREADVLARNVNILFTRMEKHIAQLDAAEQLSIEHSHELENKINKRTEALKESNQDLLSTLEN